MFDHRSGLSRKAFTLIELLIVVAIIAILAAIAVPNFLEAQTRSKVSRTRADMRTMATALESYAVDNNNKYPPEYINSGFATDGARELHAQKHLTTPISYITSILLDPFKSRAAWGDQGYYRYYNYLERYGILLDFAAAMDPDGSPPGVRGAFFDRQSAWILYSFGPDQNSSYDNSKRPRMMPYDSSNGTISFGDIFRFGPGGLSV